MEEEVAGSAAPVSVESCAGWSVPAGGATEQGTHWTASDRRPTAQTAQQP